MLYIKKRDRQTSITSTLLKNPFIESPKLDPARSWKHVGYTMYLSVDIPYIGVLVRLFWYNTATNWTYQIVEISPFHEKILLQLIARKAFIKMEVSTLI